MSTPIGMRTWDQLQRVRTDWPAAAARLCATDSAACVRTLRRFTDVAEWIDAEAIDRYSDEKSHRALWVDYLPLSLTAAAAALAPVDRAAADQAIQRGLALTLEISRPSRELALGWNAVAWQRITGETARRTVAESVARASQLSRVGRDWRQWIPPLVEQLAKVDSGAALRLARQSDPEIRAAALAAAAAAMDSAP
jgi:hypothetical protein